jgi:hypothetical protein
MVQAPSPCCPLLPRAILSIVGGLGRASHIRLGTGRRAERDDLASTISNRRAWELAYGLWPLNFDCFLQSVSQQLMRFGRVSFRFKMKRNPSGRSVFVADPDDLFAAHSCVRRVNYQRHCCERASCPRLTLSVPLKAGTDSPCAAGPTSSSSHHPRSRTALNPPQR